MCYYFWNYVIIWQITYFNILFNCYTIFFSFFELSLNKEGIMYLIQLIKLKITFISFFLFLFFFIYFTHFSNYDDKGSKRVSIPPFVVSFSPMDQLGCCHSKCNSVVSFERLTTHWPSDYSLKSSWLYVTYSRLAFFCWFFQPITTSFTLSFSNHGWWHIHSAEDTFGDWSHHVSNINSALDCSHIPYINSFTR